MTDLLLRRARVNRPGADGADDYDVIGQDGLVIGRIFKATRFPNEAPTHGYEPTREAAMQAFARSWHRK